MRSKTSRKIDGSLPPENSGCCHCFFFGEEKRFAGERGSGGDTGEKGEGVGGEPEDGGAAKGAVARWQGGERGRRESAWGGGGWTRWGAEDGERRRGRGARTGRESRAWEGLAREMGAAASRRKCSANGGREDDRLSLKVTQGRNHSCSYPKPMWFRPPSRPMRP